MRKPNLIIVAAGATLLAAAAQAENSISWEANQYSEKEDRIDVRGGALVVKHDFGTDIEFSVGMDYDTVSGATPMWIPVEGYADEFEKGKVELATESRDAAFGSLLFRDRSRNEYTLSLSYSEEPDFIARTIAVSAVLWSDASHNRAWRAGFSHAFNRAVATPATQHSQDEDNTNDYAELGFNQVINAKTTIEASVFYGRESGYQSNQYLQIVRSDDSGNQALAPDTRPDERVSGGLSFRAIRSFSNTLTGNLWYRYYQDDWNIDGHTMEARAYWTVSPRVRLNPVVRFGTQTAADFYKDYGDVINTFPSDGYGSNDERLGEFETSTLQLNAEWLASKEWTLNVGYSVYRQDNGFEATWITGGFVFKY